MSDKKTVPLVILLVLVLLATIPTIIGAAFAIARLRLIYAVALAILLPVALLAVGLTTIVVEGSTGVGFDIVAGAASVTAIVVWALFTFLGYHFARELRGRR